LQRPIPKRRERWELTIVISRWEGELDVTQLKTAMAHPIALGEELEEEPV
jgi:hypothetical protein